MAALVISRSSSAFFGGPPKFNQEANSQGTRSKACWKRPGAKRSVLLVLLAMILIVSGCAAAPTRNAIPEEMLRPNDFSGIDNIRYWGDETPPYFTSLIKGSPEELKSVFHGIMGRPHNYLAISGGGANGAFGAGLLVGWTESGTRPEFTMVTGISTGALTAPFAFLGPSYDEKLTEVYTRYTTKDLVEERGFFRIIKGDAITGTGPLKKLIARYIDDQMLQDLAAEYNRGRQLLIGTTNLDAERPVAWNITRIAASGHPKALKLIQQVLLASASIPVAFPPVYIKVEEDGQVYDEMHVDGGATSQVFFYPMDADWKFIMERLGVKGTPNLYVIRNSRLEPSWKPVKPKLASIAGRSVDSLIRTQGIGDMYRLYLLTTRDGLNYHLSFIPADFTEKASEQFDPVYMGKLFDLGYQMALSGNLWQKAPPKFILE